MNQTIRIASLAALATLMIRSAFAQEAGAATTQTAVPREIRGVFETRVAAAPAPLTKANDRIALDSRGQFLRTIVGNTGPGDVLAIRSSSVAPESEANLREDLNVMERILNKALGEKSDATAMGVKITFAPGRDANSTMYLESFGALFLLNVDFPLLPPPVQPEMKTETAGPQTGTAWEQAKKELYGPQDELKAKLAKEMTIIYDKKVGGTSASKYDADQVARIKDSLALALRNAANIRDLRADEWVTVCVTSSADTLTAPGRVFRSEGDLSGQFEIQVNGATRRVSASTMGKPGSVSSNPGTLTLRVKKSDAAALANGTITPDEFRKRVTALIY